ncbi:MAG: hypothetical protein R2832_16590 [Rhodothermales bacterium]
MSDESLQVIFTVALCAILLLPLAFAGLQMWGVAWTYRVGFRLATTWSDHPLDAYRARTELGLTVFESDDAILIGARRRQPPNLKTLWAGRWPDRIVGRADRVGARHRLTWRSSAGSTLAWLLLFVVVASVALLVAGSRNDTEPTGSRLLFIAATGLWGVWLVFLVRRARRKALELAGLLGFSVNPSTR